MTLTEARKYLRRAKREGYVPCDSGLAHMVTGIRNGHECGYWGINIDGDGRGGRLFGCPRLIWSAEIAEAKFPGRRTA